MIDSFSECKIAFTDKSDDDLASILHVLGVDKYAYMNQTHSSEVLKINTGGIYQSDGIYTSFNKIALVVKTADCMPILIKNNNFIAAVHAGWRGIKKNIIELTLNRLGNGGEIYIGPHAKSCCYEVKSDVAKYFKKYIIAKNSRNYLDMASHVIDTAKKYNYSINTINSCTICNDNFYSFRENRTKNRQFGIIWS